MPRYLAPGVYVEETGFRPPTIAESGTGVTAFVGPTARGPSLELSPPLGSFEQFARIYGGAGDLRTGLSWKINYIARAVQAFFAEGGIRLHVVRTPAGGAGRDVVGDHAAALAVLDGEPAISLVAAPGYAERDPGIGRALLAHVDRPRSHRFALLEFPRGTTVARAREAVAVLRSPSAAVYHPWVRVASDGPSRANPTGSDLCLPPTGFVAGVYARVDRERGLHKAPANEALRSATGFERALSAQDHSVLTPVGVNCLRSFAGRGHLVWGARTTSLDPEWRYVNVRRFFLHVRHSLERGLEWVVFEPNGEPLWARVRLAVANFLAGAWRSGALVGTKQDQAFFVRCDRSTMTEADLSSGRLVVQVGLAMTKPAEFLVFRLTLATAR